MPDQRCAYCGAGESEYSHQTTNPNFHPFRSSGELATGPAVDALEALGAGPGARAQAIPEREMSPSTDGGAADFGHALRGLHSGLDRLEQVSTMLETIVTVASELLTAIRGGASSAAAQVPADIPAPAAAPPLEQLETGAGDIPNPHGLSLVGVHPESDQPAAATGAPADDQGAAQGGTAE